MKSVLSILDYKCSLLRFPAGFILLLHFKVPDKLSCDLAIIHSSDNQV